MKSTPPANQLESIEHVQQQMQKASKHRSIYINKHKKKPNI